MIIYPIIILVLLLTAFILVYRKAYLLQLKTGKEEIEKNLDKPIKSLDKEADVVIKKELEPNLQKAEDLFKKKQYISAEKWYLEAVRVDPKNDLIYARLGVIYIEQKNYKDAVESLEESIRLGGNTSSRYFNISFAKNALGDRRDALNYAKRAVKTEPNNEKYRKWLNELKSSIF